MFENLKNSLFWKIALCFLIILSLLAFIFLQLSFKNTEKYNQEVSQRLHANLAKSMIKEISPLYKDGEVNKAAMDEIMHSMMVINPSTEVYLLNEQGKIMSYVAPYKEVKSKQVDLSPVKKFISKSEDQTNVILGDDPRNPGAQKVFTAARIQENGVLKGYLYIILASQEFASVADRLKDSYQLKLGIRTVLLSFILAALTGLLFIWYLTKNLRKITTAVTSFGEGNLKSRIDVTGSGELRQLSENINSHGAAVGIEYRGTQKR